MPHPQTLAGNKVIAFAPLAARVKRVAAEEGAERGTILLFTGVRYERMEEEAAEVEADTRPARRDDEIWS